MTIDLALDVVWALKPLVSLDDALIHEAVTAQALARPDALALACGDERVTYAQLDAAAAAYAVELAARGAGPGTIVPVCLPRSPRLVAALLGVLRTGAAYAAFDPRWPAERRDALVARVDAPVQVVDDPADTASDVPAWVPPRTALADVPAHRDVPRVAVDAGAPACVFFTSGTTGAPKGVVSRHRATTRLFGDGGLPGFARGRVTVQAAPAPWDAFSLELWGMLTTGGAVAIAEEDYLLPFALADLVAEVGVDTLWLTASLFNLFVDMDVDCFDGVRDLYIGGERLSVPHVERFLQAKPGIALHNGYGPVESCVFATVHPITLGDCADGVGIPVGRAAPGTGVHLVADGHEVATGEVGEICVSGDGLALGYLGDPEQTSRVFVDLTIEGRRRRVYRTGDLGVLDADGVVHFRGRADRQVKIRGYRIEPGEIETVAAKLDGITSAVVVPVPGQSQTYEHLALFYVAADAAPVPAAGLAEPAEPAQPAAPAAEDRLGVGEALADRLPPYLAARPHPGGRRPPLTANGKLDSGALLALVVG
ncbi:MAG: amino acid adenylation domain-containing protein [Kineosporiaceae bacterium]